MPVKAEQSQFDGACTISILIAELLAFAGKVYLLGK
jgi:hypothetical protein